MPKRTDMPDFLTDPAQNKFISGVLEGALQDDPGLLAGMTNTLIERAVAQIRAYHPGQYAASTPTVVREAPPWPDQVGA